MLRSHVTKNDVNNQVVTDIYCLVYFQLDVKVRRLVIPDDDDEATGGTCHVIIDPAVE